VPEQQGNERCHAALVGWWWLLLLLLLLLFNQPQPTTSISTTIQKKQQLTTTITTWHHHNNNINNININNHDYKNNTTDTTTMGQLATPRAHLAVSLPTELAMIVEDPHITGPIWHKRKGEWQQGEQMQPIRQEVLMTQWPPTATQATSFVTNVVAKDIYCLTHCACSMVNLVPTPNSTLSV
jgi:hypothetical protein